MKRSGQIVLFRFPQADLQEGKLRPALLLGKLPGEHGDWLICMISSQVRHYVPEFDEIVREEDSDFATSGLKVASVIRVGRLAVVEADILLGAAGEIAADRLQRIKTRLSQWLEKAPDEASSEIGG
jgi:mRNA interferase MazF